MSFKDDGSEPTPKSGISINSLSWSTLEKLYVLYIKLWTPVQLLLAAGGLVMAIYYGNALRLSLFSTHHSLSMVLAAKLEPTRNTDQGIAAFLLSKVKDDWSKGEYLNRDQVSSILQDIKNKVHEVATKAQSEEMSRRDVGKYIGETIGKLDLKLINSGSTETWQTAIVSKRNEGFMVVPAMSLRGATLAESPLTQDDQPRLVAVLKHNPEIRFDLRLAAEIEPIMRRMDNANGERLSVIQTYFITESGVFLIRANGVKRQGDYYGDQFQPYTQFMDRPYFWGAVDTKLRKATASPFDYGTKPYLDLGGNGIVVTFSKEFELPNQRVGVLCVDAKLPDEITDEIEQYMKSMGAKVSDFYWIEGQGLEPSPLPPEFRWFETELNKSREAKSQVLGNIATEPPKTSFGQSQGQAERVVRFTVPVASGEYRDGIRKTRLLRVEFDPATVVKNLTTNLVLFTIGIILVIAVTWSLFWDYTVLKREMSNVLEKMSEVMTNASTPFVWLDERNEFVKVNESMLKILEHDNIQELRKQSRTFKGLVTQATQKTYEDILEKSAKGQQTGEYAIDVITKTGKVLKVRAHGERIPYPTWWRRGLPHRFGIFVEVVEPAHTSEIEPITGKASLA